MDSESIKALTYLGSLILFPTLGKIFVVKIINYHLDKMSIKLPPETKKGLPWVVSSLITFLTGYFALFYYLVLR